MTAEQFRAKYGIPVVGYKSFYTIYVEELKVKNRNPAKLHNMCKDVPFELLKRDHPEKFDRLMEYIQLIEDRINWVKTHKPMYYRLQVKNNLDNEI